MGIRRYLDTSFTLGQSLSWFWTLIVLALLGAHFYRASDYGMVLCTAGMLVLRCSPLAWKRWAAGFFLLWGRHGKGDGVPTVLPISGSWGLPTICMLTEMPDTIFTVWSGAVTGAAETTGAANPDPVSAESMPQADLTIIWGTPKRFPGVPQWNLTQKL